MAARFLIRLDDACPQMHVENWARIEKLLDSFDIKPIVAVIPCNQNLALMYSSPNPGFWQLVRSWEAKGWDIALHGFDHVYVTTEPGLVPYNQKSEFAGLPYAMQAEKILSGWEIFRSNNIVPKIWVAPAHTFDANTLHALSQHTTIRIISDGLGVSPYCDKGFTWLPQQLWRFRSMPFGIWTVCLHPSTMKEADFAELGQALERWKDALTKVSDLDMPIRGKSFMDRLFTWLMLMKIRKARGQ
jgi:predicted deacetylase